MTPIEKQPQQKILQPFKRIGERVAQPKPQNENILETPAIKAYFEMIDKEPKVPTNLFEGFHEYIIDRQRFEQGESLAIKRGEPYSSHEQLIQYNKLSPEVQNTVDLQLSKEAKDAQFDGMAKLIQDEMWNDNPLRPPIVKIKPAHEINIGIKDDGTIINRSGSGVTISYTHKDIQKPRDDEREYISRLEESLTFGIRYVTGRKYLAQEAKDTTSDEELEKGVKSYFVQRTHTTEKDGRAETETNMIAIPLTYVETEDKEAFYRHLYNAAKSIEPETVIPKAKERVQTYRRRNQRAA